MIDTVVNLVAIPSNQWGKKPLQDLVIDALVAERRVSKGSNLENERLRYTMNCDHIERLALSDLGVVSVGVLRLPPSYIGLMRQIISLARADSHIASMVQSSRLGATFFPPATLEHDLTAFEELIRKVGLSQEQPLAHRAQFLRETNEQHPGFGVIEVQEHLQKLKGENIDSPTDTGRPYSIKLVMPQSKAGLPDEDINSEDDGFDNEIKHCLETGRAVNFSNPTHVVITELLHQYAYDPKFKGQSLRVVYGDGTEAAPIELGTLAPMPQPFCDTKSLLDLKVALVSMRHLEMDANVDCAWFLNQQVSRPQAFSSTDAFCYRKTLEQLELLKQPTKLLLYQTGLQPAVVGFYRALIEWFSHCSSRGSFCVVPEYFRYPSGYKQGTIWL